MLEIYTDGSHIKGSKIKGCSAYCEYENREYSFYFSTDILDEYGISSDKISNPTMEFLAFAHTLKILSEDIFRLDKLERINFYIDYVGVKNWMDGSWKCKTDHIIKIKKEIDIFLKKIYKKKEKLQIEILHVKAHSNNLGNDKADLLAKGEILSKNNFKDLFLLFNF